MEWLLGLFLRCAPLLRRFCQSRRAVSGLILNNKPDAALEEIKSISSLSESWWAIEKAIHIKKELQGIDAKAHIKKLREQYPHLRIDGITHDLLLLSESRSSDMYIKWMVGKLREYKSSGLPHMLSRAQAESTLSIPLSYDPDRRPTLHVLHTHRVFSLFDQYHLFRSIIIEKKVRGEDERPDILARVVQIAEEVNDAELLRVIRPTASIDGFVENVIDCYTKGRYETARSLISDKLATNAEQVEALIEIYARCKIYTDTVAAGSTFFDRLATGFSRILQLDIKSEEISQELLKVAVKFRDESWAKSLLFHLLSLKKWACDVEKVESARLQTFILGEFNTPRAKDRDYRLNLTSDLIELVPEERRLRYSPNRTSLYESDKFAILSDYLKTQSTAYLERGQYAEAIDFCIDCCLNNSVAFGHLPIGPLCDLVPRLEKSERKAFVSGLLLYDIYSKEIDSQYEEVKSALFEEFLEFSGTYRPSEIFADERIDIRTASFLERVCVPNQLDNIIEYVSNDEVVHERVAIIDLLVAQKVPGYEALRAEKDRVLENLFAEKLRAKIESGKLFVDVQALEGHRKQIYAAFYDQAKNLEGGLRLDPLPADEDDISSSDTFRVGDNKNFVVAASEKSSLLARLAMQVAYDFALNENYGLDKYLSAEVRHVVFETQLRSCFEKSFLVTAQKDGDYLTNEYWLKKYQYVSDTITQSLDVILREFSQSIDEALAAVNEQFRVKVSGKKEAAGVFDFSPYHYRLIRISEIIDASGNFDDFFKNLIAFMWDLAGEGARAAQRLINERLMPSVLAAIDKLERDVGEVRGLVAMHDLSGEIRAARSSFTKEVELVLNWFRFVGVESIGTNERLTVVIEAAVSSFEAMFRHKNKNHVFDQQKTDVLLTYGEARALFISLFTALENALRYGVDNKPVRISHSSHKDFERIVVSNAIDDGFGDPVAFVAREKDKWTEENSKLSIVEGGSGIYKIYNLLTHASPGFSFNIDIAEGMFNAIIELRHEIFNHRR